MITSGEREFDFPPLLRSMGASTTSTSLDLTLDFDPVGADFFDRFRTFESWKINELSDKRTDKQD